MDIMCFSASAEGISADAERFCEIKNRIVGKSRERSGIGTLQEKTIHAVLKEFYAPDENMQEISIGRFVADIYTGSDIMEIQTGHFDNLRRKLDSFLSDYPVTVIYPVPRIKYLIWVDTETGECSKPRKSTVKGSVYRAFYELYKIKKYLSNPNLRLRFPYLELEEHRLLDGWSRDKKRGSSRYDRIPVALFDEMVIEKREDYLQFLPNSLPEKFTAADLAQAAKIPARTAGLAVHVLCYLEVIGRIGKKGRAYLYQVAIT